MGTPSDGASEAAQQSRTDTGNDRIIQTAGEKLVPFTARRLAGGCAVALPFWHVTWT